MIRRFAIFSLSIILFVSGCISCGNIDGKAVLTIQGKTLEVDLLTTNEKRDGAKYLLSLPENKGILICYPRERYQYFKPNNDSFKYSTAFITRNSTISEIVDYSENGAASSAEAKYILITSEGWLSKNGVKRGDKVQLPKRLLKSDDLYQVKVFGGWNMDIGVYVDIADDDSERTHGLKFRKGISRDDGMLFVYDNPHILSFWMKDTLIPLSIAFIRADKTIISIHDMKPLDETSIESEEPAKYALEARQGWFSEHQIRPGCSVRIPKSW